MDISYGLGSASHAGPHSHRWTNGLGQYAALKASAYDAVGILADRGRGLTRHNMLEPSRPLPPLPRAWIRWEVAYPLELGMYDVPAGVEWQSSLDPLGSGMIPPGPPNREGARTRSTCW